MNALKSRRTAIAVFVVVVIVFSLLGCHRSLNRRCRMVEQGFFSGELTAPATQLNEAAKYANRILAVINGVLDDSLYTAVLESRIDLLDALDARDIAAANATSRDLAAAVDAAAQAAEGYEFNTTEDIHELLDGFDGAMRVAYGSSYNEDVDQFMETVANRFPTNILRYIAFVDMPERLE